MRKGFFRYCLLSFVLFCSLAQGQALDFDAKRPNNLDFDVEQTMPCWFRIVEADMHK